MPPLKVTVLVSRRIDHIPVSMYELITTDHFFGIVIHKNETASFITRRDPPAMPRHYREVG